MHLILKLQQVKFSNAKMAITAQCYKCVEKASKKADVPHFQLSSISGFIMIYSICLVSVSETPMMLCLYCLLLSSEKERQHRDRQNRAEHRSQTEEEGLKKEKKKTAGSKQEQTGTNKNYMVQ